MNVSQAVLITVLYADIFDYPLTRTEIYTWLAGERRVSGKAVERMVQHYLDSGDFIEKEGYIALAEKKGNIKKRLRCMPHAVKKMEHVYRAVSVLKKIPTVEYIGLTGALAMENAKKRDDIDICIITTKRCVWTTRFFATVMLDMLGMRRRRKDTNVADKICLNMFFSKGSLMLPKKEQDFYSAHEVLQMKPLWDRGSIYTTFLMKNSWVSKYLPHAWNEKKVFIRGKQRSFKRKSMIQRVTVNVFRMVEPLVWKAQCLHMKKYRTKEILSPSFIRFHPQDARVWVKKTLEQQADFRNIPLDKFFPRP